MSKPMLQSSDFSSFLGQEELSDLLLESYVGLSSTLRAKNSLQVLLLLKKWISIAVNDFKTHLQTESILPRLSKICLEDTSLITDLGDQATDLLVQICRLTELLLDSIEIETDFDITKVVVELGLSCCNVIRSLTEINSPVRTLGEVISLFADIAERILFTPKWLTLISPADHHLLVKRVSEQLNGIGDSLIESYGAAAEDVQTICDQMERLGRKCFQFYSSESEECRRLKLLALINACFKNCTKIAVHKKESLQSIVLDFFATIVHFRLQCQWIFQIAKFWIVQLKKIIVAYSKELASIFEELKKFSLDLASSIAPKKDDPDTAAIKRRCATEVLREVIGLLISVHSPNKEDLLPPQDCADEKVFVLFMASLISRASLIETTSISTVSLLDKLLTELDSLQSISEDCVFAELKEISMASTLAGLSSLAECEDKKVLSGLLDAIYQSALRGSPVVSSLACDLWLLVFRSSSKEFSFHYLKLFFRDLVCSTELTNAHFLSGIPQDQVFIQGAQLADNLSYFLATILESLDASAVESALSDMLPEASAEHLSTLAAITQIVEILLDGGKSLPPAFGSRVATGLTQICNALNNIDEMTRDERNLIGLHFSWGLRLANVIGRKQKGLNAPLICKACGDFVTNISQRIEMHNSIKMEIIREGLCFISLRTEESLNTINWIRFWNCLLVIIKDPRCFEDLYASIAKLCQSLCEHKERPRTEIMYALWGRAQRHWYIERTCFETTIVSLRSGCGDPSELVPLTIYDHSQAPPEHPFTQKLKSILQNNTACSTSWIKIPSLGSCLVDWDILEEGHKAVEKTKRMFSQLSSIQKSSGKELEQISDRLEKIQSEVDSFRVHLAAKELKESEKCEFRSKIQVTAQSLLDVQNDL